jgi:hypothetical protein
VELEVIATELVANTGSMNQLPRESTQVTKKSKSHRTLEISTGLSVLLGVPQP